MVEKKSLTQDELQKKIKELVPDWKAGENERGVPYIERVKHASTYMDGIDFVTKVAEAAEANNHTRTFTSTTNVYLSSTGPIHQGV